MGQYHILVNIDRKEFVHGHRIDNGLKLMEQCGFEKSTASALWLLTACSNGRGGGDAKSHPMIGRWAGDRIAVIGDYCQSDDIKGVDVEAVRKGCYAEDGEPATYTDISHDVKHLLDFEFGGA